MAGYLEEYGVDDARRARRIKLAALLVVVAACVALAGYLAFRNFREKRMVAQFLSQVNAGHLTAAYAIWGCTAAHPCRDYGIDKFQQDWGAKPGANPWHITSVDGCSAGVIVTVDSGNAGRQPIWVERSDLALAFSPWTECQGKKWRFQQFLNRLFHR